MRCKQGWPPHHKIPPTLLYFPSHMCTNPFRTHYNHYTRYCPSSTLRHITDNELKTKPNRNRRTVVAAAAAVGWVGGLSVCVYIRSMASDLFPLDVNYNRVPGWLVDRHKLPPDWLKRHQAIQKKVSEAALDLPQGFLSQFPGGEDSSLNYFVAKQIRDKLAETSERGLFGRLAGSAGTWDKLVKAQEKSLVYLGEAGQILAQNVDFEIPFLKKQGEAIDKQIADHERKHADCIKNAVSSAGAFEKECRNIGIQGNDIRTEVLKYSDTVFNVLQVVVEAIKGSDVEEARVYYSGFTRLVHGSNDEEASKLAILSKIRNDEVEPVQHNVNEASATSTSTKQAVPEKDRSTDTAGGLATGDEGNSIPTHVPTSSGIDWDFDIIAVAEDDTEAVETTNNLDQDIDWDIDVAIEAEEAGIEGSGSSNDWEVVEGNQGCSDQEANLSHSDEIDGDANRSNAVLRIVWDAEFRSSLLDELMELQAFLLVRKAAFGSENSGFIGGEVLPDVLERIDENSVDKMLKSIQDIVDGLISKTPRELIMLKTSIRWLEKVVVDLEKKAGQEAKWRKSAAQLERKKKELQKNLMSNSVKLTALIKNTKMVRNAVEEAMSQQFGGRKINIVGDMSGVLQ